MTLTPERLAKSREEFEAILLSKGYEQYMFNKAPGGDYLDDKLNIRFYGWIERQESLVVELPKTQEHKKKDQPAITNMKSGFNVCIGEIKQSLQSAGINYRERG